MTRFRASTGYSCNVACQKPKDKLNCKGEDDAEELKVGTWPNQKICIEQMGWRNNVNQHWIDFEKDKDVVLFNFNIIFHFY